MESNIQVNHINIKMERHAEKTFKQIILQSHENKCIRKRVNRKAETSNVGLRMLGSKYARAVYDEKRKFCIPWKQKHGESQGL